MLWPSSVALTSLSADGEERAGGGGETLDFFLACALRKAFSEVPALDDEPREEAESDSDIAPMPRHGYSRPARV